MDCDQWDGIEPMARNAISVLILTWVYIESCYYHSKWGFSHVNLVRADLKWKNNSKSIHVTNNHMLKLRFLLLVMLGDIEDLSPSSSYPNSCYVVLSGKCC